MSELPLKKESSLHQGLPLDETELPEEEAKAMSSKLENDEEDEYFDCTLRESTQLLTSLKTLLQNNPSLNLTQDTLPADQQRALNLLKNPDCQQFYAALTQIRVLNPELLDIPKISPLNEDQLKNSTNLSIPGEVHPRENGNLEFKNYWYPFSEGCKDHLRRTIASFLSSKGGRIYIGITDSGDIRGISLTGEQKRELEREILLIRKDQIFPSVNQSELECFFIPLYRNQKLIPGRYVVKVVVKQGDRNIYYVHGKIHISVRDQQIIKDLSAADLYAKRTEEGELTHLKFDDPQPHESINCFKVVFNLRNRLSEEDLAKFIAKIGYETSNKRTIRELYKYYDVMGSLYTKFTNQNEAYQYKQMMISKVKLDHSIKQFCTYIDLLI